MNTGGVGVLAVVMGIGLGLSTGCAVAYAEETGGATNSNASPAQPPSSAAGSTSSGDGAANGSGGRAARQRMSAETSPAVAPPDSLRAIRGSADATATDIPSADLVEPSPNGTAETALRRGVMRFQPSAAAPIAGENRKPGPEPRVVGSPETASAPAAADQDHTRAGSLSQSLRTPVGSAADVVAPAAAAAVPAVVLSTAPLAVVNVGGSSSAPVMTAQTVPAVSLNTGSNAVAAAMDSLLSVFGLGSLAAGAPLAPVEGPALWGLLAWTRREFQRTLASDSAGRTVPELVLPAASSASAAAATGPATTAIGWLTGPGAGGPYQLPRTNNTAAMFGIAGTDLGIMWDNGIADNPATPVDEHQILFAFGDTFSGTGMTGTWRSNTLFRSSDATPADGITVAPGALGDIFSGSPLSAPNFSRQIIASPGYLGRLGKEVTIIPTSGISVPYDNAVGARQYLSYMSVKSWDTPGRWTTNYAAVAYSDDNGQTWTAAPASIRSAGDYRTTTAYVAGNQNFQQSAFVRPAVGSADADYVYMFGTPSGRGGTVYLSRVKQTAVPDQTKYEYWNGSTWVLNKPSAATPILPGTTSGVWIFAKKTYPTAGEMSVQYNNYLQKYVMMYTDSANNVVMRTAGQPQGPWSTPVTLVTSKQYQGLYAPMMNPWTTGRDVYWTMSMWGDYNVLLMHTRLV